MRIAITGHRPHKLGNDYNLTSPLIEMIKKILVDHIETFKPTVIISGMALGIDTLWAKLAIEKGIPLHAYVPFTGFDAKWPQRSVDIYRNLLNKASLVKICSNGGYHPFKLQVRNMHMVDNCDLLIAVWDGSSGGTANCVKYAQEKGVSISRINPDELRLQWMEQFRKKENKINAV